MSVTIQEVELLYSIPNRTKKKLSILYNSQITKCTEQRKDTAAAREQEQVTRKCRSTRIADDLSPKTMKAKVTWKKQKNKTEQLFA